MEQMEQMGSSTQARHSRGGTIIVSKSTKTLGNEGNDADDTQLRAATIINKTRSSLKG